MNQKENGVEEELVDIWSSILDSVASSKATPTKSIFILGEPNCGKTTFVNFVEHSYRIRDKSTTTSDGSLEDAPASQVEEDFFKTMDRLPPRSKLALTHRVVDLKDEESEDTMARLNFYTLSESDPRFQKVLEMGLSFRTYPHAAVVIFMDWSRPWCFLDQLLKWLRMLELVKVNISDHGGDPRTVDDPERWTQGKAMLTELQERLVNFIHDFKEFKEGSMPLINHDGLKADSSTLTPGCLTRNLGIPLVVVCSKSDKIKQVERDGDYKEDKFDFIQQCLRAVCLQYGATLIYTSIHRPKSFSLLRNYLLHRLFGVTGSTIANNTTPPTTESKEEIPGPSSKIEELAQPITSVLPSYLNLYKVKGKVMEREQVFVPAGWDSFNKIRLLGTRFNCDLAQRGMEVDLVHEVSPYLNGAHRSKFSDIQIEDEEDEEPEEEIQSLNDLYSNVVSLPFKASRQANKITPAIEAQPEQQFLSAHHVMFQNIQMDPSQAGNFFHNQLSFVGTVGQMPSSPSTPYRPTRMDSVDTKGGKETASDGTPNPNNASNSFFKMLAMKENHNPTG